MPDLHYNSPFKKKTNKQEPFLVIIYVTSLQPCCRSSFPCQRWTAKRALEAVLRQGYRSQSSKLLQPCSERLCCGLANGKEQQTSRSNGKSHSFPTGRVDLLMFLTHEGLLGKTKNCGIWFLPSPHTNQSGQEVV